MAAITYYLVILFLTIFRIVIFDGMRDRLEEVILRWRRKERNCERLHKRCRDEAGVKEGEVSGEGYEILRYYYEHLRGMDRWPSPD